MQSSNPFPNPLTVPFPYCLSEALARAYARAREQSAGASPSPSDIFAAYARSHEHAQHHPDEHAKDGAGDGSDPSGTASRLDIAELLGVLREPIAWVFTLAERRAQGDPVDLAAIQRVRDAALHRVDAIIAGSAHTEPPRIRAADLLTVASLLIGTLDPAIVQRATQTLGGGLVDALSALLPLAPAIAGDAASGLGACAGSRAPDPLAPFFPCDHVPHATVPFAALYGALGMPVSGPLLLRRLAPPWYWPHVGIAF